MLIMKFIESLFSVLGCIALVSSGRGKMINCLMFTPERLLKLEQKLLKPCLETFRPNTNGVFTPILSFRMALKRKKLFQKGRTLISYFRSYYGILMQATAQTIDSMCVQLWPQSFGQLSVPNIWRCMHNHFSATDPSVHFGATNDDLIGFFNSVPQHRLLDAVRSLICAWRQKHGDVALSVDMSLRGPAVHTTHVGHFSRRSPIRFAPLIHRTSLTLWQRLCALTFSWL